MLNFRCSGEQEVKSNQSWRTCLLNNKLINHWAFIEENLGAFKNFFFILESLFTVIPLLFTLQILFFFQFVKTLNRYVVGESFVQVIYFLWCEQFFILYISSSVFKQRTLFATPSTHCHSQSSCRQGRRKFLPRKHTIATNYVLLAILYVTSCKGTSKYHSKQMRFVFKTCSHWKTG